MHLMTFMTLQRPSILFRAVVLGAQGVFYNLFCESYDIKNISRVYFLTPLTVLSYLISPKSCHRFVGYLEEEAVTT